MKPAYKAWPWSIYGRQPGKFARLGLPVIEYYFFASVKSVPGFFAHAFEYHARRLLSRIGIRRKGEIDVTYAVQALCSRMSQK